jgi:hypothetical protein
LFDAYHVFKPLSQQLLPFRRSGDGLEELTFGVEQFSALFVRGGQSACLWRTVRDLLLVVCSSCSRFSSLSIRRGFEFLLDEVSTVRGCLADSPWVPGGQSACSPWTVRFSGFASGGSVGFNGRSAALGRMVCGTGADSPRYPAGQSARPLRTVRPTRSDSPPVPGSFVPWFDSSPLLSCFRVCFKESFLRLEVDP